MPAFASISNARRGAIGLSVLRAFALGIGVIALPTLGLSVALAAETPHEGKDKDKKEEKTLQPEDDDFSSTPFTEYGEFSDQSEEDAEMRFFQFGRFFGIGLGMGFDGVTGNRGLLWQGGFPGYNFKLHCWLDFNFAIALGFRAESFYYDFEARGGRTDINIVMPGIDLRYYIDTKDLSSAISFSNPYLIMGLGIYNKTDTNANEGTQEQDTAYGVAVGAGFEFPVKAKSFYIWTEARFEMVNYKDTGTKNFKTLVPDLTGNFYSLNAGILFTW